MATLIEEYRKACVNDLFNTSAFNTCFTNWKPTISTLIPNKSANEVFNLGDHLRNIFQTTNSNTGRTQTKLSSGGAAWEGLICWYLNLCNIGRRTIVIKHKKNLIPNCVLDAITVNYGNFQSNTESDIIAITFPDKTEYNTDISLLNITGTNGNNLNLYKRNGSFNLKLAIDTLAARDFNDLEINIIQCKTNWNDNAQIPMLWDMVYNALRLPTNVTVGKNGYSVHTCLYFSYSFVTLPSNNSNKIKNTSTCVQRVRNLSGGNYWGRPTQTNVAASVKEILTRNLLSGASTNHLTTLGTNLPLLQTSYNYFNI